MCNHFLLDLSESVDVECPLSVGSAHLHVSKLKLIFEFLPSATNESLASLPVEIWVLILHQRNHLSPEKPVGRHIFELSGGLDRRIIIGKLDIVYLLLELALEFVEVVNGLNVILVKKVLLLAEAFLFLIGE